MLEIRNLSAGYGGELRIQDLSWTFRPGTITTILGPNGSGKTTLLKALLGLLPAQSGSVLLEGCPLDRTLAARDLAYLSQLHTVPSLTAGRVVLHGRFSHLRYPRRYTQADLDICRQVMEEVGITSLKDQLMETLSGGQQQKVYLAMALAKQARVYLFDEPNTFLDVRQQQFLRQQMQKLRDRGCIVVAVLHDLSFAMALSDEVLVLDAGRLAAGGSAESVRTSGALERCLGVRCRKLREEDGTEHYFPEPV